MLLCMCVSGEELIDMIGENYDVYDRIRYLCAQEVHKERHVICIDDGAIPSKQIVGVLGLQDSPWEGQEDVVWGKFVSVDENYRRQGIATRLVRIAGTLIAKQGKKFHPSTLTDQGTKCLLPVLRDLETIYPGIYGEASYQ